METRRKTDIGEPSPARKVRLQPKSLFQIPDGGMITGIANGLSVYLDIDVRIVRAAFVILMILTRGAWAIAYFIMIFVIPVAKTEEDMAKAEGRILDTASVGN